MSGGVCLFELSEEPIQMFLEKDTVVITLEDETLCVALEKGTDELYLLN